MRIPISRLGITNLLCLAIGVLLAYDLPWFYRAYQVLPGYFMELWTCVDYATRAYR